MKHTNLSPQQVSKRSRKFLISSKRLSLKFEPRHHFFQRLIGIEGFELCDGEMNLILAAFRRLFTNKQTLRAFKPLVHSLISKRRFIKSQLQDSGCRDTLNTVRC